MDLKKMKEDKKLIIHIRTKEKISLDKLKKIFPKATIINELI